jgi:hypothetical protein
VCAAVATVSGAACGSSGKRSRPVATLATAPAASIAFSPIRDAWGSHDPTRRTQVRGMLEDFLMRYPDDGLAALAKTYLAFELMGSGKDWEMEAADRLIREQLATLKPGATRDLALTARARWLRINGRAGEAFELLRPLAGKIVDHDAREVYAQEVTLAAVDSSRPYEAIAYMDAWLRSASADDREYVRGRAREVLAKLPPSVVEGSLRAMQAQSEAVGYGVEIRRELAQRLADVALEDRDAELAAWLISPAGAGGLVVGEKAARLSELSLRRRGIANVNGRTIGLLLPSSSATMQEEAAAVSRGIAWALELPRVTSRGDGVRLLSRDDGGDASRVEAALDEVAADGASIVIVGLEPKAAARALVWGERRRVPVVALSPPERTMPSVFGFVVGESPERELEALIPALEARNGASRAVRVAPIVDAPDVAPRVRAVLEAKSIPSVAPTPCAERPARAGDPRFPFAAWASADVNTYILAGGLDCARDLVRELDERGRGGTLLLTLEATGAIERAVGTRPARPLRILAVSAGLLPVGADATDAEVAAFTKRLGRRPDYWSALGRDAAALARIAVRTIPVDEATTEEEVRRRRDAVREAFASARTQLWTTEAQGVGPDHTLPRTLGYAEIEREVQASSKEPPSRLRGAPKPTR